MVISVPNVHVEDHFKILEDLIKTWTHRHQTECSIRTTQVK